MNAPQIITAILSVIAVALVVMAIVRKGRGQSFVPSPLALPPELRYVADRLASHRAEKDHAVMEAELQEAFGLKPQSAAAKHLDELLRTQEAAKQRAQWEADAAEALASNDGPGNDGPAGK